MRRFWQDGLITIKLLAKTVLFIVFAVGGYITAVDSTDYNAQNSLFLWLIPPANDTHELNVNNLTFDWPRIYKDGRLIGYSLMCNRCEILFYSLEDDNKGIRIAHCAKFQCNDKKWWM